MVISYDVMRSRWTRPQTSCVSAVKMSWTHWQCLFKMANSFLHKSNGELSLIRILSHRVKWRMTWRIWCGRNKYLLRMVSHLSRFGQNSRILEICYEFRHLNRFGIHNDSASQMIIIHIPIWRHLSRHCRKLRCRCTYVSGHDDSIADYSKHVKVPTAANINDLCTSAIIIINTSILLNAATERAQCCQCNPIALGFSCIRICICTLFSPGSEMPQRANVPDTFKLSKSGN